MEEIIHRYIGDSLTECGKDLRYEELTTTIRDEKVTCPECKNKIGEPHKI